MAKIRLPNAGSPNPTRPSIEKNQGKVDKRPGSSMVVVGKRRYDGHVVQMLSRYTSPTPSPLYPHALRHLLEHTPDRPKVSRPSFKKERKMFALHVWCTKSLDLLSISFSVVQRGVELKINFKSCFFFFFASHISLERRNTRKRCVRLCHARQNVHPLLIVHPEAFPTCNPPLKTIEHLWQKRYPSRPVVILVFSCPL